MRSATVVLRLLQHVLIAAARSRGEQTAIVAGDTRLNYGEVTKYACRLAQVLQAGGLRRGDRVVIFMENGWQFATAVFGILLGGGVFVPVNSQVKAGKLAFILEDCEARALVTEVALERIFAEAARRTPGVRILCASGGAEAPEGTEDLASALTGAPAAVPQPTAIPLDLAALIYTSGTTGSPKGVMHTHQSLVFALEAINEYMGITPDDRLFSALPLSFGYGLFQWLSAVKAGATLVLESSFAYPAQAFKRMQDEAVTCFAGVPTAYAMFLSHEVKQRRSFPTVRLITNAAAELPRAFGPGIQRLFPNARLYRMYGQTECIRATFIEPSRGDLKPDSVGGPIPGTELILLGEDGEPVAPGEVGMLHVRGPHVMRGYWRQPEKTAAALVEGLLPGEVMLRTGDLFRQDSEGDFYFVARSDDIIKTRGEKVSPVEVEDAIYALQAVRQVIVLGVPDDVLGQSVCAYVSLHDGASLSAQAVKRACAERLENYMIPKYVVFVEDLPKSSNGKLSRTMLREQFAGVPAEV